MCIFFWVLGGYTFGCVKYTLRMLVFNGGPLQLREGKFLVSKVLSDFSINGKYLVSMILSDFNFGGALY